MFYGLSVLLWLGYFYGFIRVRTQLDPPRDRSGQDDACEEVSGELVVARCDAPEILEPGEHAFDEVALAVGFAIMGNERLSPGDRRDDGLDALLGEQASQSVGVIGLVGDQPFDWPGGGQQVGCHHDVVEITRSDQQDPGPASGIGQRVDGGRAAAARATDGFLEGPPFPPAAERCALTWELSIAAVPITPVVPVSALKIASQMP